MPINAAGLLKLMSQRDISDIHLKADSSPVLRHHGRLVAAPNAPRLAAEDVRQLPYQLMTPEQAKVFESEREMDLGYSLEGVSRFRVNIYRQRGTIGLSLRLVPLKVRGFEDLNLPREALEKLAGESRGLILVAGITGAGKTTTLNSFIDHLNRTRQYRIITIEDPIEFFHQDVKSSIVQREVGSDTRSFAAALRHVLRQDPDVVVLGEMRDLETVQAALMAAETGHLVLSTIHTMDAVETIDRLVGSFPSHQHGQVRQQLAFCVKGIIAQRLVLAADGKGRYPANEVLVMNGAVRRQVMEGRSQELYKTMEGGSYYQMRTFDQDLLRLVREKKIDQREALENATNQEDLAVKLRGEAQAV